MLILSIFSSCASKEDSYFAIKAQNSLTGQESDTGFYRIVLKDDLMASVIYPISVDKSSDLVRTAMIQELLSMEGDERLCAFPISNWGKNPYLLYTDSLKYYSLQVEALFLINQIFLEDPFENDPMAVLTKNSLNASINGPLVKEAYNCYREWFKELQKEGYAKYQARKISPLRYCDVKWFPGTE